MVLGWKQPDKIGGAEITGYYVNYREVIDGVPGKWREANVKAVSEEAYKVSTRLSVAWRVLCMTLCLHAQARTHPAPCKRLTSFLQSPLSAVA